MLNKQGIRELAYVVTVDEIQPIEKADRLEHVRVNGWWLVCGKGEFHVGDKAVYFEVDSQLPENKPFTDMEFLAAKHYKIKTQKIRGATSQGLLVSFGSFGWPQDKYEVGDFLTEELGVTYNVVEDNARKANSVDKYKKMAQRNGKLFSHQPFRWLMKRNWGRKLLFVFFGRKRDKKTGWPAWVVKTDEERVQNMPWILQDKEPWIVTEKIDGTSTTFTMKRGKGFHKDEFYVCSRNVVFDKPDKTCFYDTNVYTEMAEKYDIFNKMTDLLHNHFQDCEWITIQGETYGAGVQKRDYHNDGHCFMAFNFITSKEGRWGTERMKDLLEGHMGIPCVPVLDTNFILPDTVDELLAYATGESVCDHDMREGVVLRSKDGSKSFKAVSNEFLLKYHQ